MEFINEKLLKRVNNNPTKQVMQLSIFSLCQKIDNKEILLPLFQRDISWTLIKSVSLLNYQLLGKTPMSSISANKINNKISSVTQVDFLNRIIVVDTNSTLSIIDGQQRLATNFKCYIDHDDFKNIVLDLLKGKFLIQTKDIKDCQIPVGILLNKDYQKFSNYITNNPNIREHEPMELLYRIRNKLHSYNYTINSAENLTEEEQTEWFEILNLPGSRISKKQLKTIKEKIKN